MVDMHVIPAGSAEFPEDGALTYVSYLRGLIKSAPTLYTLYRLKYSSIHEPHYAPLGSYEFLKNRLIENHVFCLTCLNLCPCSPRLSHGLDEI